jgi:prephenate dehydrogenase/cyclohexadieny/prephenate dehydrogenase
MWFIRIIFIEKNTKKKIANKIFIYEKSNSNISKIKKLKLTRNNYKKIRGGV